MIRTDEDKVRYIDESLNEREILISDNIYHISLGSDLVYEILSIPMHITTVICFSNVIEKLKIPDGVTGIVCNDNPLKSIELFDSVIYLDCRNTDLKSLRLPSSIETLYCDNTVDIENFDEVMKKKGSYLKIHMENREV